MCPWDICIFWSWNFWSVDLSEMLFHASFDFKSFQSERILKIVFLFTSNAPLSLKPFIWSSKAGITIKVWSVYYSLIKVLSLIFIFIIKFIFGACALVSLFKQCEWAPARMEIRRRLLPLVGWVVSSKDGISQGFRPVFHT